PFFICTYAAPPVSVELDPPNTNSNEPLDCLVLEYCHFHSSDPSSMLVLVVGSPSVPRTHCLVVTPGSMRLNVASLTYVPEKCSCELELIRQPGRIIAQSAS